MTKKSSAKNEDQKPEFEVELGGKGLLGGFFKGLSNLIDLADKLDKTGGIEKSGTFGVKGQKDMSGVYGFSIRSMAGPGGAARPVVRPFGDISKFKSEPRPQREARPKGPVVEEATEPLVDLFDEGDLVRVVAELPGADESEISCEVKGDDVIEISTTGKKKYSKEILLEAKIDPASLEKHYNNGVLEMKLKKSVVAMGGGKKK